MGFKLRPGTSVFGNVTFTPGTNENYVAPPEPPIPLSTNPLFLLSQYDDTPENGPINDGSVYIYDLDDLTQEPIIKVSSTEGGQYGSSAYRSSKYLFIGSRGVDSETVSSQGVVYVYDVNDLNQLVTTLSPSNPTEYMQFGLSLSGDEDSLLVSCWSGGIAYLYDMNDLSADPIEISEPVDGFSFGRTALVLPNHIVLSELGYSHNLDSANYLYSGAMWVYDRNDLSSPPTLVEQPEGPFKYSQFAKSLDLSVDGSKFVVGCAGVGNIYVYDSNNPLNPPLYEFILSAELKNRYYAEPNEAQYSSVQNALNDTHFVTGFHLFDGQDVNGDYLTAGRVYIWPHDDPSATPTTLSGFDLGITRDSLGTPAWNPEFGNAVKVVGDKLIASSNEGTPEIPDRPGTVRVFDINNLSSPLKTITQPYSEYVPHDLFGVSLYAPGPLD
jgi:hypothetical protein